MPVPTQRCNDVGSPLVKHNYSAGSFALRGVSPSICFTAAPSPCDPGGGSGSLSQRALFFFFFFRGVVPIQALLFRTGTLLTSLVRQALACRLTLGPAEVLVV